MNLIHDRYNDLLYSLHWYVLFVLLMHRLTLNYAFFLQFQYRSLTLHIPRLSVDFLETVYLQNLIPVVRQRLEKVVETQEDQFLENFLLF